MSLLTRIGDSTEGYVTKPGEPGIAAFRREMGRAFDRAVRAIERGSLPFVGEFPTVPDLPDWPAIDVSEDDKALTLTVDVPGIETKDVEVEVAGDLLTIKGSRQQQTEQKNGGQYRRERFSGSFTRSITLPEYIDPTRIEAKCDKGVLTVTAPKVPGKAPAPRKVPVKA